MKLVLYYDNYSVKKLDITKFDKLISFNNELVDDKRVVSIINFKNSYSDEYIVIPSYINDDILCEDVYNNLLSLGFTDEKILFIPIEMIYADEKFNKDNLLRHDDLSYLDYLELCINDYCNLNCKGCSHFANLSTKTNRNFDAIAEDMKRLKVLIPHIFKIRIMGGEPLLNPELIKYIGLIKKIYPYTDLRIVTNGLLVDYMSEDLINSIVENDVMLDISIYPPLEKKYDILLIFLKQYQIKYFFEYIGKFKPILLAEKMKYPFKKLMNCHCINLYEGKLASCPLVFTIKYFNKKFNNKYNYKLNYIDIYDPEITGIEIKKRLLEPFELCDYCAHYRDDLELYNWKQRNSKKEILEDDWVYKEK